MKSHSKAGLVSIAFVVGTYALVEWVFAYVTEAEGLFSPKGSPNTGALALGVLYLAMRIAVRWLVPVSLGVTLAMAAVRGGRAIAPQSRQKCRLATPTSPANRPP